MATRPRRSALEESPEYFWERFSAYAQTWPVSPEPLGSPVLEVLTPLGPLLVFDRTLPPVRPGETPLLLHGQVESWEASPPPHGIRHLGGGRYQLTGQVEAWLEDGFFLLQLADPGSEARLRLLLVAAEPPPEGSGVAVRLRPPLMAFRPDAPPR